MVKTLTFLFNIIYKIMERERIVELFKLRMEMESLRIMAERIAANSTRLANDSKKIKETADESDDPEIKSAAAIELFAILMESLKDQAKMAQIKERAEEIKKRVDKIKAEYDKEREEAELKKLEKELEFVDWNSLLK